ncbi:MAG TPA: efflux RND transporter periplasmic adaptor subunit, partial [Geoalkalibacter subterraneus]|nr:efflux RND transporter periplasmic adaptor subunit [Geoalkalibacter subterraneus]
RHEAALASQVSGRIVETSPNLLVGGLFEEGDLLFAIEDTDFRLAVQRAQAALTRAQLDLRTMEGQARVGRREWERLGLEGEPDPLVVYEPQLESAQADVKSARAQLDQTLLDLERTRINAPFNGRIARKEVDLGQYINAGSTAVLFAGTNRAEVIIPLPIEDLARLNIPHPSSERPGSEALVRLRLGTVVFKWSGRITRSLGEVDPQGRMARVVVDIIDPYNLKQTWPAENPSLEPGMFVTVELKGEYLDDVVPLPRKALRSNDSVWIASEQNTLDIRPVEVVHREEQTVYVRGEIEEDDRIILTPLPGAAAGMKLRQRDESR